MRDRITDATSGHVEVCVIRFLIVRRAASGGTNQEAMRRPARCCRSMAGFMRCS
jgi:hypothetical protein